MTALPLPSRQTRIAPSQPFLQDGTESRLGEIAVSTVQETPLTFADLIDQLGVSPKRIRLRPPPETATEQDVLDIEAREDWLFELVDGVLVEKVRGYGESLIAVELIRMLANFVKRNKLGLVSGPDGMIQLMPGLVRIPDVAFVSWERLPNRKRPRVPIPALVPDLAVEILSEANTEKEMERKLQEYFQAGVRLVWLIDPKERTARVYTGPQKHRLLHDDQALEAGKLLPGFKLPLRKLLGKPE